MSSITPFYECLDVNLSLTMGDLYKAILTLTIMFPTMVACLVTLSTLPNMKLFSIVFSMHCLFWVLISLVAIISPSATCYRTNTIPLLSHKIQPSRTYTRVSFINLFSTISITSYFMYSRTILCLSKTC